MKKYLLLLCFLPTFSFATESVDIIIANRISSQYESVQKNIVKNGITGKEASCMASDLLIKYIKTQIMKSRENNFKMLGLPDNSDKNQVINELNKHLDLIESQKCN